MNIKLVGVHKVDEVWPCVRAQVQKALERGNSNDLSLAGLYKFCRSGQGFLFVSDDLQASLILGFESDLKGEVARILTFSSDVPENWNLIIEEIAKFAKANDVHRLLFNGRMGWQRVIKNSKLLQCEYEMDI